MSTFWKNVHRLAQDQLFAHGYLAPATAALIAARRQASNVCEGGNATPGSRESKQPWPRLAALR